MAADLGTEDYKMENKTVFGDSQHTVCEDHLEMLQTELRAKQCSFYNLIKRKHNPYTFIVVWMPEAKGLSPDYIALKTTMRSLEHRCFIFPLGVRWNWLRFEIS